VGRGLGRGNKSQDWHLGIFESETGRVMGARGYGEVADCRCYSAEGIVNGMSKVWGDAIPDDVTQG
jgi:hypothetical protein